MIYSRAAFIGVFSDQSLGIIVGHFLKRGGDKSLQGKISKKGIDWWGPSSRNSWQVEQWIFTPDCQSSQLVVISKMKTCLRSLKDVLLSTYKVTLYNLASSLLMCHFIARNTVIYYRFFLVNLVWPTNFTWLETKTFEAFFNDSYIP